MGMLDETLTVNCDYLTRIVSETFVYLHAHKIIKNPQVIGDLLTQLEIKTQSGETPESKVMKKHAAVVCAMLIRLFDLE